MIEQQENNTFHDVSDIDLRSLFDAMSKEQVIDCLVSKISRDTVTGLRFNSDNEIAEHIIRKVSAHFDTSIQDIKSKLREGSVLLVRYVAIALIKDYTKLNNGEIGSHFKSRHPSTIINSLSSFSDALADLTRRYEWVKTGYNLLKAEIKDDIGSKEII